MKYCKECGIRLTEETRYKSITALLCKIHFNEKIRLNYPKFKAKKALTSRLWATSDKGKESVRKSRKRYYATHKGAEVARKKLINAVKMGKIIKPDNCLWNDNPTSECKGRIEAHHYLGYEGDHWKDVQWLCVKHHRNAELNKNTILSFTY